MITSDFLSRLQKVKKTRSDSWLACCPAHGDKSPSMTIRELSDGRLLVHCFAGCSVENIVGSIGLELSDLFPEKPVFDHSMPQRRERFNPFDVMRAVAFEARVAAIASFDMARGNALDEGDRARLLLAAERLNEAEEMIYG